MSPERARIYVACWGLACSIAVVIAIARGKSFAIARREYWRALLRPWKVTLFAIAITGMMLVAPYTGDPTWDWFDAGYMALLTFTTAPWTLGVLVRARRSSAAELYVAACTWLFSAGWSYDLYIWLRDRWYPLAWSSNLVASSVLYGLGGAMWSLQRRERFTLSFLRDPWPDPESESSLRRLWPVALLFVLAVTAMLAPFLLR